VALHLSENKQCVYSLVIDLAAEEGYFEPIPSVSVRDRKHLYQRLQTKHFPSSILSCTDRDADRKSSGVLVSGFTDSAVLTDLLKQIEKAGALLQAIHSPLTLVRSLCKELNKNKGAHLLVVRSDHSRIRMIACIDAQAVFTRQVVVATDPKCVTDGITETLTYLNRCEIHGWETPLVTMLGFTKSDYRICEELTGALVESEAVKKVCGALPEGNCEKNSISVLDKLLAYASCRGQAAYAGSKQRHLYLRRKLRCIAAAAAISALGGAASTVAVANKLDFEHESLTNSYQQAVGSTDVLMLQEERYEYSVEAVRQALITAKLIEAQSQGSPLNLFSELATVVSQEPGITLSSVSWHRQDELDDKSLQAIFNKPENIDKLLLNQFYRTSVTGSVEGAAGAALDRFESFVNSLRKTSTSPSVVIIEAPFGLGEHNKTTAADLTADTAVFTIELVRQGKLR